MIELRDITLRLRRPAPVLRRRRPHHRRGRAGARRPGRTGVGQVHAARRRHRAGAALHRRHLTGDVLLDGVSIVDTPPRERAHVVGYVGQDPLAGFVTDTVEEELAYGMEQLGLPPDDDAPPGRGDARPARHRRRCATATCARCPAASSSGSPSARCSPCTRGCWCSTSRPRRSTRPPPRRCSPTLTRLVHDLGVTVLIAEHRLERVVPFADRMCLLDRRRRVAVGEPGERARRLARRAAARRARPARRLGAAAADASATPGAGPAALADARARRRTGRRRRRRPRPAGRARRRRSCTAGTVARPRASTSTCAPGRVTALMGRNGSGQVVAALGAPGHAAGARAGTVDVGGVDPAELEPRRPARAGRAGAADRRRPALPRDRRRGVRRGRRRHAGGPAAALLDRLVPGIPDDQHPRDLSEGQRLALALALRARRPAAGACCSTSRPAASTTPPSAALAADPARPAADGHAVLVATHDVEFVAQVADEVVVLAEGEVVSAGPARRVRRRVAGVRAAGHQGPRPAVAARRRGRGGAGERRPMSTVETAPSRLAPALGASVLGVASLGGLMMLCWPLLLAWPTPATAGRPAVPLPRAAAGRDRRRARRAQRGRPGHAGARRCSACSAPSTRSCAALGAGTGRDRAGLLPAGPRRPGVRARLRLRARAARRCSPPRC